MANWYRRWRTFWNEKVVYDWRYKLGALVGAFMLWAYLAGQQNMQSVVTAPVYYQKFPAGMVMVDQRIHQVSVTLSGRRDLMLGLKNHPVWIAIDLSNMRLGHNVYRITKNDAIGAYGLEVKAINPRQVAITLVPEPMP
jgi:hypothetical protein